ncbi:MAG: GNAT family N-acetyltransferase [Thermodesulfobacteriota bacterium]
MVEPLDSSHLDEIMEILVPAFAGHPVFPPSTPRSTVAALLTVFLDAFFVPGRSSLFGIRQDGRLACVSLSLDPRHEPKGWAMARFFYRVMRVLGLRDVIGFIRAFSSRPKYAAPYLELFLIGTDPGFQKRGLGREMLRHLYRFAVEHGFRGLILGAARESAAYGFYAREGFVTDSETSFRGVAICNMRREAAAGDAGLRGPGPGDSVPPAAGTT